MNQKSLSLIFSALCILASSAARADLLPQLQEKLARSEAGKTFQPAVPIREAKLGMLISRIDLVKDANGSFSQKTTEICKIKTTIKVYDFRVNQDELNLKDIEIAKCHSDIGGNINDILVDGLIMLWKPLVIDQTEDIKELALGLEVQGSLASKQNFLSLSSGTKDLNAKSFVVHLRPEILVTCKNGTCVPSIESYFIATVDIED